MHLFDCYHHDESSSPRPEHQNRTFLCLEHDMDLGRMEVRPERFGDKVEAFFAIDDIDFESDEF